MIWREFFHRRGDVEKRSAWTTCDPPEMLNLGCWFSIYLRSKQKLDWKLYGKEHLCGFDTKWVHEFVSPCSWRLQLLPRVFCLSNSSKHFAVNKHLTRGDLKSLLRLPPLQVEKKSIIIDYWNDVLVFYVPLYSLVSCNPWKKRKEKKRRGIDFVSFVYAEDKVIAVSLTICSC